ncbi:MAG: hypothetical protein QW478_05620 [Candidatus Micrarchaeaceae archaeon]
MSWFMEDEGGGYDGYSKSIRAEQAEENGEHPKTFWKRLLGFFPEGAEPSSWHHTSKFYNPTNYYDIESINDAPSLTEEQRKKLIRIAKLNPDLDPEGVFDDVEVDEKLAAEIKAKREAEEQKMKELNFEVAEERIPSLMKEIDELTETIAHSSKKGAKYYTPQLKDRLRRLENWEITLLDYGKEGEKKLREIEAKYKNSRLPMLLEKPKLPPIIFKEEKHTKLYA